MNGMIFPPDDDTESCIFAPHILRIYRAIEVSTFFSGEGSREAACLDVLAGDEPDALIHVAVGITPSQARSLVDNARIIHRPLVFWFGAPVPGCVHLGTGKPVLVGFLDRLGTRDSTPMV
jgi:hypothetical protein